MGNYSYTEDQIGCRINIEKLKTICKAWEIKEIEWIKKQDSYWENKGIGFWIDGWKIHGYWYDSFVEFLYACAYSMENLTENKSDNYIDMEEEQGFQFVIHFYLYDGIPTVSVNFVPMEWQTMELDRPNKPIQIKIEE